MKLEFQAVILAAGEGSRLSDLTAHTPKCILPVGNKPMVWYSIQMLEKAGFQDAILVTRESEKDSIWKCLSYKCNIGLQLDIVAIPDNEDWGTADTLRYIKDKLHSDVVVVSCDLILAGVPLHRVADVHRVHDATCTALFSSHPPWINNLQPPGQHKTKQKPERDLVGTDDNNSRLLYIKSEADLDGFVSIRRSVFGRYSKVNIRNNLHDAHLYIFSHQVLDLLVQQKSISSIKGELLPYLVKKQFSSKPLFSTGVEAAGGSSSSSGDGSVSFSTTSGAACEGQGQGTRGAPTCHVYVSDGGGLLAVRANTLPHYVEINRQMSRYMSHFSDSPAPLVHPDAKLSSKHQVSVDSMVGSGSTLGDKAAVKRSVLGDRVTLGSKCKVTNCLLMDHVNIGDGCDISGSILGANVTIESNVRLKDCLVSNNQRIKQNSKISNETLADAERMMEI